MSIPQPKLYALLRALYGDCAGLLNFRAIGTEHTTSAFAALDDHIAIKAFLDDHILSRDLYLSMSSYADDTAATAANAVHLPALFADIDFRDSSEADARRRLANFLYPPSIMWHSGGGLHGLWLMVEPFALRVVEERQRASSLLRRLAITLGADMASAEANHILRVPHTYNRKPAYVPPRRVEVEVYEPARRYQPSEFDDLLPSEPAETAPGQPFVMPVKVQAGQRNRQLFKLGRSLKAKGIIQGAIWASLSSANREICNPPVSDEEVKRIFLSVLKAKDRKAFVPLLETPDAREEPAAAAASTPPPPEPGEPEAPPPAEESPAPEAVPPVDLAQLLDDTAAYLQRFVVMTEHQSSTLALWVGHSHTFEAAECTPYIHVTAGTKRSGKTLLLEMLEPIVRRPWLTMRTTTAALPRKIDAQKPTLLLDESDQALREKSDYSAALTGVLNSGYRKSGTVSLCVGEGSKISVSELSTFCPKAISGIGKLPDTIGDRSIAIKLRRRMRSELVERATLRQRNAAAIPLRRRWESWAPAAAQALLGTTPGLPPVLDDRAQDVWEPLLAIAELASPSWAGRARRAAVALSGSREDEDHAVQLLADIREVMEAAIVEDERGSGFDVIVTTSLLKKLHGLSESLWPTWSRGAPLTAHALATLLEGFDLHSAQHRVAGHRKRGYRRDVVEALFLRYLGPDVRQRDNASESGAEPPVSDPRQAEGVSPPETPVAPMNPGVCPTVSHSTPPSAGIHLYPAVPLDTLLAALRAGREPSNGHELTDLTDATPVQQPQPGSTRE